MGMDNDNAQRLEAEALANLDRFGWKVSDEAVSSSVASELARIMTAEQVLALSDMGLKWLRYFDALALSDLRNGRAG